MAQTIGRMLKKIVDRLPRSAAESGPGARMMAAPEFGSCVGGQGEPTVFGGRGGLSAMVRQAKKRISMKLKRAGQRSATAEKIGLAISLRKTNSFGERSARRSAGRPSQAPTWPLDHRTRHLRLSALAGCRRKHKPDLYESSNRTDWSCSKSTPDSRAPPNRTSSIDMLVERALGQGAFHAAGFRRRNDFRQRWQACRASCRATARCR